jgi:flagellar basal body-associated protein FliL
MRVIVLLVMLCGFLSAEIMQIEEFATNLLSKYDKTTKKVEFSLVLEGRDMLENEYKIFDAINIVSGSFFAEDLITSKVKEAFKTTLINYLAQKEGIGVEKVYMTSYLIIDSINVDELIDKLQNNKK